MCAMFSKLPLTGGAGKGTPLEFRGKHGIGIRTDKPTDDLVDNNDEEKIVELPESSEFASGAGMHFKGLPGSEDLGTAASAGAQIKKLGYTCNLTSLITAACVAITAAYMLL